MSEVNTYFGTVIAKDTDYLPGQKCLQSAVALNGNVLRVRRLRGKLLNYLSYTGRAMGDGRW